MPNFSPVSDIPTAGIQQWEQATLGAMKNNLDMLTGLSGSSTRAITNDTITVSYASMNLSQITATGVGYTVSGVNVPQLDDYSKLLANVTVLANDLYNTQQTLNALIQQLKA